MPDQDPDDPPGELDPVIPFRLSDRLRIKALEVKVNATLWLLGAGVVGVVALVGILLTGVKVV
jgi:hypothetical protein